MCKLFIFDWFNIVHVLCINPNFGSASLLVKVMPSIPIELNILGSQGARFSSRYFFEEFNNFYVNL